MIVFLIIVSMTSLYDIPETADKNLFKTELFIEGTDGYDYLLVENFKKSIQDYEWCDFPVITDLKCGYMLPVGAVKIDNDFMPVCLVFQFLSINDHKVCFYTPVSLVVDYRIIDRWFEKNFRGVPKSNDYNAMSKFCVRR